jgi:predicted MPP superfamily phosphohydrolase
MAARSACRLCRRSGRRRNTAPAYGHIVEQGRHMIVSGGLGCSKVPLRLGVPPEILRIEII